MTVKELIKQLEKYPQDMLVCVTDYERGTGPVEEVIQREASQLYAIYTKGKRVLVDYVEIVPEN